MKSQIHQLLDKLTFTFSVKFNGIFLLPKRRRWFRSEFRDDDFLLNELKIAGFRIKKIFQATETDKQTGFYLSKS